MMKSFTNPTLCLFALFGLAFIGCEKEEKVIQSHENGLKKISHLYSGDHLLKIKTFHMNNIRATETEIKDGHAHGNFKRWSTNGILIETGSFDQGDSSGLWSKYLSRTEKVSEGNYSQGKKNGVWKEFWPQGVLKSETHWEMGKPVGITREWFYDSTLRVEHNCHENGQGKEFYYNGQLRFQFDCNPQGQKVGLYEEYDLLGHPIYSAQYNKYSQLHGFWIKSNAKGDELVKLKFHNGIRDSVQVVYGKHFEFQQGSGHIQYPCFKDSLKNFFSQFPHEKKSKFKPPLVLKDQHLAQDSTHTISFTDLNWDYVCSDTSFVKGLAHGVSQTWEPGKFLKVEKWKLGAKLWQDKFRLDSLGKRIKVSEGGFKDNLREGPWKVFYPNGHVSQDLNFEKDHYMGDQLYYDSTGALSMKKNYRGKNQKVLVEIIDKKKIGNKKP